MMRACTVMIGTALWLLASSTAFADVQVTIQNGNVSLKARDATIRQILQEWARVGQIQVVNVDRIPGGPVTLELSNVPESAALEILLRSLGGYMATARPAGTSGSSQFDLIVVLPTSAQFQQSVTGPASAPVPAVQPQFRPEVDASSEGTRRAATAGANRGPAFALPAPAQATSSRDVPPPQTGNTVPAAVPPVQMSSSTPKTGSTSTPRGVPVPGMIVTPPPPPPARPTIPPPTVIPSPTESRFAPPLPPSQQSR